MARAALLREVGKPLEIVAPELSPPAPGEHQDVGRLLEHYGRGELLLDELISRRITLDDVNDTIAALDAGEVTRSVIEY